MRGLPRERPGTRAWYRRFTAVLAAVVIACATASLGAGAPSPVSAATRLASCPPAPPGVTNALIACFRMSPRDAQSLFALVSHNTYNYDVIGGLRKAIRTHANAPLALRRQLGAALTNLLHLSQNGLQPTSVPAVISNLSVADTKKLTSASEELEAARIRLDSGQIEPGSQFFVSVKQGTLTRRGHSPVKIAAGDNDPDFMYVSTDGVVHKGEVKHTAHTYKQNMDSKQHSNMIAWRDAKTDDAGGLPRAVDLDIADASGWTALLYEGVPKNAQALPALSKLALNKLAPINELIDDGTNVRIGKYSFTPRQLQALRDSVQSEYVAKVDRGPMTKEKFYSILDEDLRREEGQAPKLKIKVPGVETPETAKKGNQKKARNAERKIAEELGCKGQPAVGMARGSAPVLAALPMAATACPVQQRSSGLAQALQDPGGVDFTSLGLRYMSDDPGSGGVQYAFSGKAASPGITQDTDTGVDAVTNSTADLRTWLVLSPQTFWVNLNPSQPDKIVDAKLGRTNAGRALLEADLRLKRTSAKLLDPATPLGARYWKELGTRCYSNRLWIIPGDVQVRDDGSSLYILRADLSVKTQTMNIDAGSKSCHPDPTTAARMEKLERATVLPKVVKAVNTEPAYAPLRRAFLARIVAQWIRDRHAAGHRTSFDALLGSGNLGPATLTDGWRPRQVFDTYVHEVKDGGFTYKKTVHIGNRVYSQIETVGGVDFSKLVPSRIGAAQMSRQYPHLAQTVRNSAARPASDSDGTIWLGATAPLPEPGPWAKATGTISDFVTSRTGILVLVVVALGVLTFGIRGGRRRRPAS